MKKYGTFVYTEGQSTQVQKALELAGFGSVCNSGIGFAEGGMFIIFGGKEGYYFRREPSAIFNMRENTQSGTDPSDLYYVEASDIIIDPFQLDGAKQPEKMIEVGGKEYSESTLQMMIREHGK